MTNLSKLIAKAKKLYSSDRAEHSKYFFKTGPGQYGAGDIFWGLSVPEMRILAKEFWNLDLKDVAILLSDKVHELRLIGLIILVEKYKKDPLVHGKISVSLFHASMTAAKYSLSHASELKIPLLIMHGSDDLLTSPDGSREFAAKTNLAELKIWEGGYHELHNEPFKDEVFKYIIDWINK